MTVALTADETAAAVLSGVAGLGPARLRLLLRHHAPDEAVEVIRGERAPHPLVAELLRERLRPNEVRAVADAGHRGVRLLGELWRRELDRVDPVAVAADCRRWGVGVVHWGHRGYPEPLRNDPAPPAVLFVRGHLGVLGHRRVGIVGTRNATRNGLATARALGADLSGAGITVVSGLAAGIDGAAHAGAVDADGHPAGVVGNGLDRAYPRRHERLWEQVATQGVLLSEWPPTTPPDAFRFPLRNRIIAALCEVLVVVESRERGGSLLTVREALERSVEVMAVPGSPESRASSGTNRLLRDGAAPVTCSDDVVMALGLDSRRAGGVAFDPRPRPVGLEADVLAGCRADPCTIQHVVERLDVPIAEAAMALARLERAGWIAEANGWFEAVDPWAMVP